jgi:hypothetical protein
MRFYLHNIFQIIIIKMLGFYLRLHFLIVYILWGFWGIPLTRIFSIRNT